MDLVRVIIVISCFVVLSTMFVESSAKVLTYNWTVEYKSWSPDGVNGSVIAINGKFPGPTINARAKDTIVVNLTNGLPASEGVVIHWHGIRQFGTPWADGTANISQCPINPGKSFVYNFTLEKAGTYFYHGHYGMQRSAGLYGSLIVDVAEGESEKFVYSGGEFNLLLSDWWHEDSHQQEIDLNSNPMKWIGEPQTLLINGRGQFNCSLAAIYLVNSSTSPCTISGNEQYAPYPLDVHPNQTYRIRIASTTSLASLNFAIGMVVVEADGNYVKPFTVDNIDIYSGESYSVLIKTDQNASQNYWVSVSVRGREPKTPQGLTILNYLPNSDKVLPNSPPPVAPLWNDYNYSKNFSKQIFSLKGSPAPPSSYDRRIILLNTQNFIDGRTKWAINNVSLVLPATPFLGSIKQNLKNAFDQKRPPNGFDRHYDVMEPAANPNTTAGSGVYTLTLKTTVDVILQNANALKLNVSEIHPWHLHGHDFWVLGYGEGKFTVEDETKFNLGNPPLRNTAVIFPYGWTALRFVADNPGVWAFHCHLEPHLHMGMGVVFAEGVRRVGKIPKEALGCGLTVNTTMIN
ncbi:hypothetical protein OROMI_016329 [Orobanche minor]